MAVEKIVVGRDREDLKKFGDQGTAFIGKHIVGKGEESHLTNPVQMDITRPHVILVTGKRGCGKSYSAGVVAEEIALLPDDIRNNLSVLMIDTMGIFWSMSKPNDIGKKVLDEWRLEPRGFDINLFVPRKYVPDYEAIGIKPIPFSLACGELSAMDWILTFGFSIIDPYGIAIERAIKMTERGFGDRYGIDDIISSIEKDTRTEQKIKDALVNRFLAASDWGVFEKAGTPLKDIFQRGGLTVIDVSHYMRVSAGWSVRTMLVGILARKIFQERLMARKEEEFEIMTGSARETIPMVWIMIDEAHQFCGTGEPTAATEPLLTLVKEGREPGISVLMITQRPDKLHEDVLAQCDLIISHRLTSRSDIEALRSIMQTYVLEDIQELINSLPRSKGTAIVLDDNSERLYSVAVRPRYSWHAGGSPIALKEKGLFE